MSKVITFSRTFPAYHPKAGQPTNFVRKIWEGLLPCIRNEYMDNILLKEDRRYFMNGKLEPKYHTIRGGKRWKVGDKFSPRVWSGNPYNSKQIIIAPDIEIKKVWDFEISDYGNNILLNGKDIYFDGNTINDIGYNDGLNHEDLLDWFQYPKPFKGQIICWNENVNY